MIQDEFYIETTVVWQNYKYRLLLSSTMQFVVIIKLTKRMLQQALSRRRI